MRGVYIDLPNSVDYRTKHNKVNSASQKYSSRCPIGNAITINIAKQMYNRVARSSVQFVVKKMRAGVTYRVHGVGLYRYIGSALYTDKQFWLMGPLYM